MITGSWVWSECGAATYILLFTNKDKTRRHRLLELTASNLIIMIRNKTEVTRVKLELRICD